MLKFKETAKSIIITGCTEDDKNIVIPEKINNKPVTKIKKKAFQKTKITSVFIPKSIAEIGEFAFSECTNLKTVIINAAIKIINYATFSNCTNLKNILLPKSVTILDEFAFYKCENLERINLEDISEVKASAFAGCTSLAEIHFSENLKIIGKKVFQNCTALKVVFLPKSLAHLGKESFYNCGLLQSVYIPNTIKYYKKAFLHCNNSCKYHFIPGEKGAYIKFLYNKYIK